MNQKSSELDTEEIMQFPRRRHGALPGIILITLGTIFLLNNYGLTNIDIGRLWPLFLIIPGVFMIIGKTKEK